MFRRACHHLVLLCNRGVHPSRFDVNIDWVDAEFIGHCYCHVVEPPPSLATEERGQNMEDNYPITKYGKQSTQNYRSFCTKPPFRLKLIQINMSHFF